MYDNNGLELTPSADSMNAYRLTAVELEAKRFKAYASARPRFTGDWAMFKIANYKDPRDAAFVAQEFAKKYSPEMCRQMVTDDTFNEVAKNFAVNLEIPEWKYQAEGFSIEELLNGGYDEYKKNYVDNAKDALVEALRVAKVKAPNLTLAKKMIELVEQGKSNGMTYREAAKQIVKKELVHA